MFCLAPIRFSICVTVTTLRGQVARATVAMVTWASLLDPMKYVTMQGSCYLASLVPIFHTPVCRREIWQRDLLNREMVGYYGYLDSNEVCC